MQCFFISTTDGDEVGSKLDPPLGDHIHLMKMDNIGPMNLEKSFGKFLPQVLKPHQEKELLRAGGHLNVVSLTFEE